MFTLTRVLKSHIETRHLARIPAQATVQDTTGGLVQELQRSLVKALAVKDTSMVEEVARVSVNRRVNTEGSSVQVLGSPKM